ncbi:HD domain-containing protein [Rheinheimera soli]|uniref:HD domain-containing protein n=1 Tax=Rheinheimera soli TaxID=443616 RepID=UPI001E3B0F18|nr:ATP-binding protein [Rheinheimera soli]
MIVSNPIEELKSTEIYKYLFDIDKEYAGRIEVFVSKIAPILETTQTHFPYYTRHDAHHGFRVCNRIHQILEDDCFECGSKLSLNPVEVFLLIATAYAHDLGMTVFPGEKDSLLANLDIDEHNGWETNSNLQNYLRAEHSKRGGEYINKNYQELDVPKNLVHPLHDLMRSHNLEISKLDFEFKDRIAAQETEIAIKQLSLIVCIADALEFSDTRVVEGVIESLEGKSSPAENRSYMENMKHVCIGDSVAIGTDGRVIFSGTFDDAEVLSLAHNTIDNIEEWVRGYCDLERSSPLKRLKISPQTFSRNLKILGADFERIGVRINKENIINLITSNSVWKSDLGLSVKELLQNAVEACRYRAYNTPAASNYEPKIKVVFDRANNSITVIDNGCGMSKHTILNNFLTVGNSRSKDKAYVVNNYHSIARFGIGFWSVFTIAQKATIQSAPYELTNQGLKSSSKIAGLQFEVSLEKFKDYTLLKEKSVPCGTSVKLDLRGDVILDDVIEQFKSSVICSEIDVELLIDRHIDKLPSGPIEISDKQIFGSKFILKDQYKIQTYHWEGSSSLIDICVKFAYRMENGHATFMLNATDSLMNATDNLFNSSKVAVCGFTIPLRSKNTCFDLGRIGAFVANKKTPEGFEFTLDRQQLLENASSETLSFDISSLIHQAYREFLQEKNSYTPEHIYNLNMQSAMHGGNTYDQYTGDELSVAYKNHPDLICYKLYKVSTGIDFFEVKPLYVNLGTLLKMSGEIWFNQNSYNIRSRYTPAEDLTNVAYQVAQSFLGKYKDIYIAEPNRPASMLFDYDESSTIKIIPFNGFNFCIQIISIGSINPTSKSKDILDGIRGQWAGTVYLKTFKTLNSLPFKFLGRNRILVQKGSKLSNSIIALYNKNRFRNLATIIRLLDDAEKGYISEDLTGYL